MSKTRNVVAVLSILLLIGLVLPLAMAAQHEKPEPGKEYTMQDMHKCMMNCTECCEKNMKNTAEVLVLLDEAVKAMDTANAADAKMKIEKAKLMLKEMHAAQKKCMETMPAAMDRCPMTGKKIDLMGTPENQTRLHKGKKIGFCTPACTLLWDKLTDQEKNQKLETMMPKQPAQEELIRQMPNSLKTKEKDVKSN